MKLKIIELQGKLIEGRMAYTQAYNDLLRSVMSNQVVLDERPRTPMTATQLHMIQAEARIRAYMEEKAAAERINAALAAVIRKAVQERRLGRKLRRARERSGV